MAGLPARCLLAGWLAACLLVVGNNRQDWVEDLKLSARFREPCKVQADGTGLGNTHVGFCQYYNGEGGGGGIRLACLPLWPYTPL